MSKVGRKTKSNALKNMDNIDYQRFMRANIGGNSQFIDRDSGISPPTIQVGMYFKVLMDYACNRFVWKSDIINPYDLQQIEHLLFLHGRCFLIYPEFYRTGDNKGIKVKTPMIFHCNIFRQNRRTGEILAVNVNDNLSNGINIPIRRLYGFEKFAVISSEYNLLPEYNQPVAQVAWEYANKLYELDLAFNANARKQRLPLIINNGVSDNRLDKQQYNTGNFTVGDIINSAMQRNEPIVEIPQSQIGSAGILHNTNQYNENNMREYLETQRKVYDEYFEFLGISVVQERHGVYQSVEAQQQTLSNNNYKSAISLRNRRFYIDILNKKYGLDLHVELLNYM